MIDVRQPQRSATHPVLPGCLSTISQAQSKLEPHTSACGGRPRAQFPSPELPYSPGGFLPQGIEHHIFAYHPRPQGAFDPQTPAFRAPASHPHRQALFNCVSPPALSPPSPSVSKPPPPAIRHAISPPSHASSFARAALCQPSPATLLPGFAPPWRHVSPARTSGRYPSQAPHRHSAGPDWPEPRLCSAR